ncbi:M20/M25/M40 family metallo-hydrolase [Aequorivita marisscotiae]|uniref:M20/M25/M40 family metallo-hydrolase n=1 Tax=Aequorivita marisscotiae TaxID=3040348 RepID=A0ABY8KYS8_9FLAO|nr:M20/M25/M40 family metallo-hydrolase [Aequorivita sp. Ant34-E75]WGF93067.1 M20/M25/M40 family metallo-hydrolase [Aequorivita sp. Ant34-E75]
MKKFTSGILMFLLFTIVGFAQNDNTFYATMDAADAVSFKALYPDGMTILASNDRQAAVLLSEEVSHSIHDNVKTHGPGYIFRASAQKALQALEPVERRSPQIDFSITEDAFVNECLDLVDGQNIEDDILNLQNYGTRYHTKSQAELAVLDQQAKWDAMIAASGRTDVHTRIFNHVNTPMPSVIITFDGANTPDEFVIIGGHIDSTTFGDKNNAPGADDNASGIASLNEMVRVLLEKNFVPNRTIEVMAFAAEEIGLVGSAEIAEEYANNGVNVAAYVQFDMTGYNGSSSDIYITTDWYNSNQLNTYLTELMDHYNSNNPNNLHNFTYGYTECGYGCSDHASWADNGYDAAFPFEARMGEDNPNIHSPGDVYSFFNTPEHSVKFAKLGLEFLIEAAKPQILSVDDFSENAIRVFVKNKTLNYQLNNTVSNVKEVSVYNVAGQRIISENVNSEGGSLQLSQFAHGFYIVHFTLENGHTFSKKFILN